MLCSCMVPGTLQIGLQPNWDQIGIVSTGQTYSQTSEMMNAIRRAELCHSDPAIESSVAYLDWDRCKLQLSHLASCVIQ